MGYYEVLRWLINRRAMGDLNYFSPPEISKGLKDQGLSTNNVAGYCLQLEYDGNVEAKMNLDIRNWCRKYRATKRVVSIQ